MVLAVSKKKKSTTKIDPKTVPVDIEMHKKMIRENKVFAHKVNRLVPFMEQNTFYWQVKREKGGVVPACLKGKFTSKRVVDEAILQYKPSNNMEVIEVV